MSKGYFVPAANPSGCASAADCPSLDQYDNVISLDCSPGDPLWCAATDETYSNAIPYALFGESYPGDATSSPTDGAIREAVPIAYCHRFDAGNYEGAADPDDFAYCVLTDTPNLQPIPPMMHCEADQYLGAGSSVTYVGFGDSGAGFGVKRTAVGTLNPANAMNFALSTDAWSPGEPSHGDSGGGLFVQLPDQSWRVAGIILDTAGNGTPIWHKMAWIAQDPNVDISEILPCHTPEGTWAPGPECGGFVTDPGAAAGAWARAPSACYHPNVSGPSQTCGSQLQPGTPEQLALPSTPPGEPAGGGGRSPGSDVASPAPTEAMQCSLIASPAGGPSRPLASLQWSAALLLLLGPPRRRTRRALAALAAAVRRAAFGTLGRNGSGRKIANSLSACRALALCALATVAVGCIVGGGGSGDGADSTGGGCEPEIPQLPPAGNPEFTGTISGEGGNERNTRLVVANIARAKSDTSCCQDFVMAGTTSSVRIRFAAPYEGLTVFANRTDEFVSLGTGRSAKDLAVGDVNGDGRNDIIVLRDDSKVFIAKATSAPGPTGPYFGGSGSTGTVSMTVLGSPVGSSLVLADMDADGDLDLILTTTTDRILWSKNAGNGTFGAPSSAAAGVPTQRIAAGKINGDNSADVVVSGSNGKVSYLRSTNNGWATPKVHTLIALGVGESTPGMPITLGTICPGHPGNLALIAGYFDEVHALCGDGGDGFTGVLEPHGEQIFDSDYVWDPDVTGPHFGNSIMSIAAWQSPDASELFVLTDEIWQLTVPACHARSALHLTLADWSLAGDSSKALAVHAERSGDASWGAISTAGTAGLRVVH